MAFLTIVLILWFNRFFQILSPFCRFVRKNSEIFFPHIWPKGGSPPNDFWKVSKTSILVPPPRQIPEMVDLSERWWELWAEHVCIRIKKKGGYRRPPSSLVLKWEVVGVTDGGSPVQPLAIPPDRWRLTFDQPSSCHRWPSFHHQLSFHRLNHNKWRAGSIAQLPLCH